MKDENIKNEYIEFQFFCVGCMPSYTYGEYVYLNNGYDEPEENHFQSILKTQSDIYITSLSKLMDE